MRTTILLLTALILSISAFSQKSAKDLPPGSIYKSLEDYKAKKAIPDYSVMPATFRNTLGKETIEINKSGSKDRMKVSELPGQFLTELPESEGGVLMRVFDNEMYYVITDGPICFYVKKADGDVYNLHGPSAYSKQLTSGLYFFARQDGFMEYYSEGITGEIKKLKESELEKRLEAKGLKAKYEADKPKREKKDSVYDYQTKLKNWTAKYIRML
jgi:hypothetical protein